MTILRVWQECSRNLLWIIFCCTSFPRPLVRARPNNSLTVEFSVRGAIASSAILPSSRGPLGRRWSGLGRLTAIPLHRLILQGWEFFFLSLSACSFASITRSQKRRTASYSCGPLNIASTIAEGVNLSPMTCRKCVIVARFCHSHTFP